MIPKTIHYVWLSGETKPEMYLRCIESWKRVMPDFEIKEWSMLNLPQEVLGHHYVAAAIKARKWAFATDYIRAWLLSTYGGLYLDSDVYVYRSFEPFLVHRAFSSIEFQTKSFYESIRRRRCEVVEGLNIEAAILGCEQGHPWMIDILHIFDDLSFEDNVGFLFEANMPKLLAKVSRKYGFKYRPVYQLLDEGVHIYPPDVFSFNDETFTKPQSYLEAGSNLTKYSNHLCAHSWYEDPSKLKMYGRMKFVLKKIVGEKAFRKLVIIKKGAAHNPIFEDMY